MTLKQRFRSSSNGFTLTELLMTIAVFSSIAGMAAVGLSSATRHVKGTSGMQQVMAQMRIARDMAISQRRSIEVQFVPPNEIRTLRWEVPSGTTTMNQYFLEGNVEFYKFTSVPDTPEGFGAGSAISFSGQTVRFLSNGRFVDATSAPVSGTVFLAIQGEPISQRAMTVFGGTGRVRGYTWNGTAWLE